jgi:hypothetical protein
MIYAKATFSRNVSDFAELAQEMPDRIAAYATFSLLYGDHNPLLVSGNVYIALCLHWVNHRIDSDDP